MPKVIATTAHATANREPSASTSTRAHCGKLRQMHAGSPGELVVGTLSGSSRITLNLLAQLGTDAAAAHAVYSLSTCLCSRCDVHRSSGECSSSGQPAT